MSTSPSISDASGSGAPPVRLSLTEEAIALIVSTRAYDTMALIPMLLRQGFTSAERPPTEAGAFLRHLRPGLVVAVIDPVRQEDQKLLTVMAQRGSFLLVLAPALAGFADALRLGADVCITDEAGLETLEAQVEAFRRRRASLTADPQISGGTFAGFVIERGTRRLRRGREVLQLTPMEFSILTCLVDSAGRVVSSVELLSHVTGRLRPESEAAHTVKVYIRRLRQKLEQHGSPVGLIINIRGYGYMIEKPESD